MNNPSDHIRRHGDEYLFSPAATLSFVSDAINSPDATDEGKVRAFRIIDEMLKEGRVKRFPRIDVLETVLLRPSDPRRRLEVCDSFVKHIGNDEYMAVLERAGFTFDQGSQA
ncbi:hypothetical protein ACMHYJ_05240 [Castellaniella hirudinis]|uniref:hypothetical protein n=1 Tax=Castellaniella hirudinis TaxID=1144617 RepID=UPI0039C155D2